MIDFEKEEEKLNWALAMPPDPIRQPHLLTVVAPYPSNEGKFINELQISFAKCELEEIDRLYSLACGIALRHRLYDLQRTIEGLRDEAKKRYQSVLLDIPNKEGYTTSERRPDGYMKEKYHRSALPDLPTQSATLVETTVDITSHTHNSFLVKYWSRLEKSPTLSNAVGGIIAIIALSIFGLATGFFKFIYGIFKHCCLG